VTTANPLDQLKDIHLPEAIGFWPPALGWWLLAALLIIFLIIIFVLYQHRQKSAYRRLAIQHINLLFNNKQTHHQTAVQLNQLLKTVAQHTYSTTQVSRLSASQWLTFLDSSANMQAFKQGPGQILATAPYDPTSCISNPGELKTCCIQWVRRHQ